MSKNQMLISYQPGEECRVAILEGGTLEDYHAERPATANRVNNLYLGKVTNVENSLQAAFVDFGGEESAFLHSSDIHPQYFPDEDGDTLEKIGKKTARRDRPPIQQCLKKGQKIVIQILKDGVGTKGPAATTYLSIPGRYLVMMPQMDNIGVSRNIEDEDLRRKMRDILDQIDLPDGFGFILRTAGFGRTKTDLKRDLAYLQRLWKNIESRRATLNRPSLLYTESDLLVRALRDLLTSDIKEIIIDHEQGLARAANFLKVVAPRSGIKLLHYNKRAPMFHAYGVEEQVRLMIAREVPLPSGGRLVIDETEALVAIDVNSGKSRKAKDAETNAYKTNLEAVDEICRQLKLRELGGLVINDLIDMNQPKHRREVEQRFRDRLKKDRAKSTTLAISPFGILEMTRQRMRPSAQGQHYDELPAKFGRGWVRKPESVSTEALRELALVLSYDRVMKVELIVPGRVAGDLLSNRRRTLTRMELVSDKSIAVRVSDTLGTDRFTIYAYDEQGNDIDLGKLAKPKVPKDLPEWTNDADERAWDETSEKEELIQAIEDQVELHPIELLEGDAVVEDEDGSVGTKKKRRRRRRGRGRGRRNEGDGEQDDTKAPAEDGAEEKPGAEARAEEPDQVETQAEDSDEERPTTKKKRKRRGRRRSSTEATDEPSENPPTEAGRPAPESAPDTDESRTEPEQEGSDGEKPKKKRRRRRRSKASQNGVATEASDAANAGETPAMEAPDQASDDSKPAPKKKSRRRSSSAASVGVGEPKPKPTSSGESETVVKKPRLLYASSRRKLKPSEKSAIAKKE